MYMKGMESRYGRGNWKKGIPIEEYEKSLMRHLHKYIANKYEGASLEPEIDHLAAAMFNLMGLMHEQEKQQTLVVSSYDYGYPVRTVIDAQTRVARTEVGTILPDGTINWSPAT
jgi:hypothetical protein